MTIYELFVSELTSRRQFEVKVNGLSHSIKILQQMDKLVDAGRAEKKPGWPPAIRFNSASTLSAMLGTKNDVYLSTIGNADQAQRINPEQAMELHREGHEYEAALYEI